MSKTLLTGMDTEKLEFDFETPAGQRARLDTGPLCNYDCEFCYYKDRLHEKTLFDVVKERADYLLAYGIKQADLSGGESSVSPDWFKILDYCNSRFEHISCLSHGGKFADIDFCKESQQRGLKEILFSLHGATEDVHDSITGRKQSFQKIVTGINNAKSVGLIVRTNVTVYYKNYKQLENQYAELINRLAPSEVNFITLNYWGDANIINKTNVNYQLMTDAIKKCIDNINIDAKINVRYVPYCYMKGYEKYVVGTYQHIYDPNDWNRELFMQNLDVSKQYTDKEKIELAYAACASHRAKHYTKPLECITCKNFYICDGVEKEVNNMPVYPEPGEKIKKVLFYK